VFLPDLTCELRAWPYGTWTSLSIDPHTAAGAEAAGHDIHARAAPPAARPPGRSGVPTVVASHQRPPTRRAVPVGPHRRVTPDAAACPRVSGTWTAWRTAIAGTVRQCLRQYRVDFRTVAGLAMRAGHRPYPPHLYEALACGSSGPEHRVRPCTARVARPRSRPACGGGRTSVRAADRCGNQTGHVCRTPSGRTAVVPEAADGQSADRSGLVTTSSTLPQGRPCGRPSAAAVLGWQRHDRTRGRRPRPPRLVIAGREARAPALTGRGQSHAIAHEDSMPAPGQAS
jgi:hypothetical protein